MEVHLGSTRFFRKTIRAKNSVSVPLVANLETDKNGLEKPKETSISWPQGEKDEDTYVLSASIPHEGWLFGRAIDVNIDFKKPQKHEPVKSVLLELISQESIFSAKKR